MWKFVSAGNSGNHPLLVTLNDNIGRQTWEFEPDGGSPELRKRVEELRARFTANRHTQKHSSDELLRLQCAAKIAATKNKVPAEPLPATGVAPAARVEAHLKAAIDFYGALQADDGHWPGDYGGPMFLMPGLVIALYTMGQLDSVYSAEHKKETLRYLANHQNEDGGWGLHIEGGSTMFGTALKCALRARPCSLVAEVDFHLIAFHCRCSLYVLTGISCILGMALVQSVIDRMLHSPKPLPRLRSVLCRSTSR